MSSSPTKEDEPPVVADLEECCGVQIRSYDNDLVQDSRTFIRLAPAPSDNNDSKKPAAANKAVVGPYPSFKDQVGSAIGESKPGAKQHYKKKDPDAGAGGTSAAVPGPAVKDQCRSVAAGGKPKPGASQQYNKKKSDPPTSKDEDFGPRYKDQCNSADEPQPGMTQQFNQGRGANEQDGFGPDYKDQVRSASPTTKGVISQQGVQHDNGPQDHLPSFKDQAREHQQEERVSGNAASPAPQERVDVEQPQDGENLIQAHVVKDSDSSYIFSAEPLMGGVFLRRRAVCLLIASAVLAAAVVGGVCGSGYCGKTSVIETTPAPTTAAPSMTPSAAPTVEQFSLELIAYIESIRISTNPIRYPLVTANTTPEELAIQWLLQEDTLELSLEDEIDLERLKNRFALATFYFATGGPTWITNTSWLVAEDGCTWYGISCSDDGVSVIEGEGNNLNGYLPPDLSLLGTSLREIHLNDNSILQGTLPSSIGRLSGLQMLELGSCGLSGSIPDSLSDLTELRTLTLNSNGFNSTLSSSLGALTVLIEIDLSGNFLEGTLPESIGSWSNLRVSWGESIDLIQDCEQPTKCFNSCFHFILFFRHLLLRTMLSLVVFPIA